MPAGESAATEGRRQAALADEHLRAAEEARAKAVTYTAAAATERQTADSLRPLETQGHHLLEDRRWPGSRRANVDLVVVGPSGVFIVDTKAWRDLSIAGGRIYRGQEDVTDDLSGTADLVERAQEDLAEIGLAPGEVHAVLAMAGKSNLDTYVADGIRVLGQKQVLRAVRGYGARLTPEQVSVVLARAEALFAPVGAPSPVNPLLLPPVSPLPDEVAQEQLFTPEEIAAALWEPVLDRPVEAWMSWLHPTQARLVRRSFAGPSRVRGPAGTGKTVVGLHRAAFLAQTRPGKVLVTTYVRTLPDVLSQLLGRLAPDVVGKVEFVGVHGFASRVLAERGVDCPVRRDHVDSAWWTAWRRAGRDSGLVSVTTNPDYWRQEIDSVLKGRGITDFADYRELARPGRRYRLTLARREEVWRLYQAYEKELRDRRTRDFADMILLAERSLAQEPLAEPYSAVIVDEAQDLSCAMVRMLHGLVGDVPDGFTLIGDGQQSIYPGGYTLAEAGISVAGRGVVLTTNYRNTAEILDFASQLVAADEYDDIEGGLLKGEVPADVPRHGAVPEIVTRTTWNGLGDAAVDHVKDVVRRGVPYGDIAVLCPTTQGVRDITSLLTQAGSPVVDLTRYTGATVDKVKVGTIKRAKGLEFKHVLVSYVRPTPRPTDDVEREGWDLTQRELFVGMTRARDGLWVGVLGDPV